MTLREIEFELAARQYERMDYPGLRQGQSLDVILDAGILLPDPAATEWYAVQPQPLPSRLVQVARGRYAFSGQIQEADLFQEQGEEIGILQVACDEVPLRVACAALDDGRLPFGTWETRYLTGLGWLQGMVEDDFTSRVGRPLGVTIWHFRRLSLTPGDPFFGQWHESHELPAAPYTYDRVLVTARLHRQAI